MKKLFLILLLNVLFSGNAYAGVNEPGVTPMRGKCAGAIKYYHKKYIKKHLDELKKKKTNCCSLCEL